ncbi:hypothetical protein D9611_001074 [Ephemerocybe angulata]|uniref:Uncharacterized protein n=1 Tax=Ephemerocybe angulata TaxID=980116 RepID=A0A8H5CHJ0_9AGAR|nr:hypothetical protein D9611_001074 [Tulosesus angulatus]
MPAWIWSWKRPKLPAWTPTKRSVNRRLPSDSPYSSPSYSPFEPDHNLFASYTLQQPPSIHRLLHPGLAAFRIPHALDAQAPKILDRTEHRPRRATRSTSSPPRTRSSSFDGSAARIATSSRSQQEDQPAQWKSLPAEDRKNWENLAKEKKRRSRYQEASLPVVHRLYPQAASEDTFNPNLVSMEYMQNLFNQVEPTSPASLVLLSHITLARSHPLALERLPYSFHTSLQPPNYFESLGPLDPLDPNLSTSSISPRSSASSPEDGVKIFVPQQQSASRYQEISLPAVHHLHPQAASEDTGLLGPLLAKMPSENLGNGFDWVPSASYAPLLDGVHSKPLQPTSPTPPIVAYTPLSPHPEQRPYPLAPRTDLSPLIRLVQDRQVPLHLSTVPSPPPLRRSLTPSTPRTSLQPPNDFELLGPLDPTLSTSQAELDLHGELHHQEPTQQDFSQYSWGWNGAPAMLDNNWDLSSISPAFLGEQANGFSNNGIANGKMNFNQDELCGTASSSARISARRWTVGRTVLGATRR